MKEYRLLRYSPYGYEILTIGAKEWRWIPCLFDTTPSILEFYVLYGPPSLNKPPIPVHGKLHYLPTTGTPLIWLIMVFDMDFEKFGHMSVARILSHKRMDDPRGSSDRAGREAWCIHRRIRCNARCMDAGRLRETSLGQEVQPMPGREHITWFKPLVVGDDGEALVDWLGDLVLYDFKHHTCSKIIREDDFRMTNLLFKESLIRHEFFETGYQTGFITSPMSSFFFQQQTSG